MTDHVLTEAERDVARAAEQAARSESRAWLRRVREKAARGLGASGLPHRRLEDWKFTDLRARLKPAAPDPSAPQSLPAPPDFLADLDVDRLVFVDGAFDAALSEFDADHWQGEGALFILGSGADGEDVRAAAAMPAPIGRGDAFVAELNTALWTDGVALRVAEGVRPQRPLLIVHLMGAEVAAGCHLRFGVTLEPGAGLDLITLEIGGGGDAAVASALTTADLGGGARLRHLAVRDGGDREAACLANCQVRLGRDAWLERFTLLAEPGFVRDEIDLLLDGEGGFARLGGITLLDGDQHGDISTYVRHRAPGCACLEDFRAVVLGAARGVFQGKIHVEATAQKTDSQMSTKALLLSDRAEMDNKPELEIYADDVKCSHGATTGDLDRDALFYLQARGLDEARARSLLIGGFLTEAMTAITFEQGRILAEHYRDRWLARHLAEPGDRGG